MSAEQAIQVYSTAYYISSGIMLAGFTLAAIAFFKFKIPRIFEKMTGRMRKDTVMRGENPSPGGFVLTERQLIIHTDEII